MSGKGGRLLSRRSPAKSSPRCRCRAFCVLEQRESGLAVVVQHQATKSAQVASLTKLTCALTAVRAGVLLPGLLDEDLQVSVEAASVIGTSAKLRAGDVLPVREALFGLLLPSGNDAAMALAQHIGARLRDARIGAERFNDELFNDGAQGAGSLPEGRAGTDERLGSRDSATREMDKNRFVEAMNAVAASLGCHGTAFHNPHGLDTRPRLAHRSTALDVAKTLLAASQHPLLEVITACKLRRCTVRRRPEAAAAPHRPPSLPAAPSPRRTTADAPALRSMPSGTPSQATDSLDSGSSMSVASLGEEASVASSPSVAVAAHNPSPSSLFPGRCAGLRRFRPPCGGTVLSCSAVPRTRPRRRHFPAGSA
ncbi:hypothetical protein FNF29_02594 [Cafeteria roenbergensis]|uniref:Peptidase S11 D-alanyl-D-alanine carboxypeptidase A N-terminal domain-containing protein n=2 Tax=Cafeteria roenbergensis TaxID=33653 RepID=A0A5A8D6E2_CAFRO|nr:hypothetical protein FNF29_02594 [Cafeteria roenbergensis]KAA0159820.1 hypothetical protein FNF28_05674 [Cafeteria roenbergensis]|eukprot:KAA0154374.1 hypothetical protein FNF29_02594 [Cafeteria roenbergensis]